MQISGECICRKQMEIILSEVRIDPLPFPFLLYAIFQFMARIGSLDQFIQPFKKHLFPPVIEKRKKIDPSSIKTHSKSLFGKEARPFNKFFECTCVSKKSGSIKRRQFVQLKLKIDLPQDPFFTLNDALSGPFFFRPVQIVLQRSR